MVGQPFNPYRLFTGIFIPEALVRSKVVSVGAKMAWGRLARYAGQDGRCFPAVSNLALEIGIGQRQAQKYLAELEKAKLIRRRTRFSDRAQASNSFEFLWHPLFQDWVNDPAGEGVNDPSPGGVNDSSPKESQIEESQLHKENGGLEHRGLPLNEPNYSKADYSFAATKPTEGSKHHRLYPQVQNPISKPSDPDPGQMHEGVEELSVASNCELAAVGYTAAEVVACLDSKFAKRKYRPGGRYGPSTWNWFYTVIRERFSATERGHFPRITRHAPGKLISMPKTYRAAHTPALACAASIGSIKRLLVPGPPTSPWRALPALADPHG
jgi:hypothetical protein